MCARKLYTGNTGFGQILDGPVAAYPDREAIVFGDWRLTYREFGDMVLKTAALLQKEGLKRGDRAAIISRNCPEYLIAEFAMYKLGVIPVKISWRLAAEEMIYLLDLNQVRLAFVQFENPEWGRQVMAHYDGAIRFLVLGGPSALYDMTAGLDAAPVETRLADSDAACRVHTSGTTGRPKCVVYSHGGMLDELETVRDMYGYEPGQRYQFIAQLFHSAAIGAHLCLCTGGTLVLMRQFSPDNYMQSLIREKVTAISVVPTVLKWILDESERSGYDLSAINVVRYSTCPIPPVLLRRAMGALRCRFYQSYGMTEMGSIVTTLQPEDHLAGCEKLLTTVGRPIPGAQVMVADSEDRPCAPGEVGEILVKGPGRMLEYLDNPELMERSFTDGWYHTKDMGFLDEAGYLSISGRADDMIISGGENIYPNEILNVIMHLNSDIAEAAVYGVPDEVWGEHVKASIVLIPGSKLTAADVKTFCRANMPSFRVPKEIEFLEALPKNASGKVLISELKARAKKA